MKRNLSHRQLLASELSRFVDFVRDNYGETHSYVIHPEMVRHFYEVGRHLNIYAAFEDDELIGVWPFLFYNRQQTDAAGCLFLFKPMEGLPFVGQAFMKSFLESVAPEGYFTAGIIERLLPFYRRVKHRCGLFSQFYWQPRKSTPQESTEPSLDISVRLISTKENLLNLQERFPHSDFLPRKDFWFLKKSYIDNFSQIFEVFEGVYGEESFVLVTASYETPIGRILRLYDYFGKLEGIDFVLKFLKRKAFDENCRHVDVMVAGIDVEVFERAGFEALNCDSNETIVPNNFFPFQAVNSKVHFGVRLNNSDLAEEPVVLFKGTGDQLVPRQIVDWGKSSDVNFC